ncbi:MAG: SGNH/GDSL hydrolase family protein [Candidatus Omnitrophica bacterium]|nr:SGNH/GDSL hydrolase family protein [Candidatus Omnitrophota bacterium]
MDIKVRENEKFLCIGDSITDCGRVLQNFPLGNGYVKIFSDLLVSCFPERKIEVVNKGISGNTVCDLRNRWEDDVIYHKPQWISILIGINDAHRIICESPDCKMHTQEKFIENYRYVIKRTMDEIKSNIILMEPFYISNDRSDNWRKNVLDLLEKYRMNVLKLSEEFSIPIIKLHDIFQKALVYYDADTFCPEPVHPNNTGHTLIAVSLLNALKK